jgi:hypothetical protein
MLRRDLEAAGIPYAVEGPDGPQWPQYADFHALRHSDLTLGGRAGLDLRTLQELAGHSTPVLTARYPHRRLYDLAGAVEKMPRFLPDGEPARPAETLRAPGTDGAASAAETTNSFVFSCSPVVQLNATEQDCLRLDDARERQGAGKQPGRKPLLREGFAASCDPVMPGRTDAGDRIRTGDVQFGKLKSRNSVQNPSARVPSGGLSTHGCRLLFVEFMSQSCLLVVLPHLTGG